MNRLSTFFTLSELTLSQEAIRKGIDNEPDADVLCNLQRTALLLDEVRRLLGSPILISSGYRSPELNKAIGGSRTSSHMTGDAVDFTCPGFGSVAMVFDRIKRAGIKVDQLINEYGRWVHIGFGPRNRQQYMAYNGNGYEVV